MAKILAEITRTKCDKCGFLYQICMKIVDLRNAKYWDDAVMNNLCLPCVNKEFDEYIQLQTKGGNE